MTRILSDLLRFLGENLSPKLEGVSSFRDWDNVRIELVAFDVVYPLIGSFVLICSSVVLFSCVQSIVTKERVLPKGVYFMASLSTADVSCGLQLIFNGLFLGRNVSQLGCLLKLAFMTATTAGAAYSIVLLTFDRYVAIIYALHYRRRMTRRFTFILISLAWIIALSLTTLLITTKKSKQYTSCTYMQVTNKAIIIVICNLGIVVPLVVTYVLYFRIALFLCRHSHTAKLTKDEVVSNNDHCIKYVGSESKAGLNRIEKKAVKSIFFILVIFTISWLPYFITVFYSLHCEHSCTTTEANLSAILPLIGSTSGLINPVIYSWWQIPVSKLFWKRFFILKESTSGEASQKANCVEA